mmetsp:Transcript_20949/g.41919  ORF Transcript_20949/g.41919 Transcript_20949/m.41919 type:complete len:200 (-) Transcript_20949:27-626(-)
MFHGSRQGILHLLHLISVDIFDALDIEEIRNKDQILILRIGHDRKNLMKLSARYLLPVDVLHERIPHHGDLLQQKRMVPPRAIFRHVHDRELIHVPAQVRQHRQLIHHRLGQEFPQPQELCFPKGVEPVLFAADRAAGEMKQGQPALRLTLRHREQILVRDILPAVVHILLPPRPAFYLAGPRRLLDERHEHHQPIVRI